MKTWISGLLLGWCVVSGAQTPGEVTIEGAPFAATTQVGDKTLLLNGAGLRKKAVFKVYAAGLYVPEKSKSAATLLAQTGPRQIRMQMLRNVHAESFAQAMSEGLHNNHGAQQRAQFKSQADALDAVLRALGEVKKGDVVVLEFVPTVGLRILFNGRVHGTPIAGDDFYAAVLRVWIGDKPADDELKKGLLGGD